MSTVPLPALDITSLGTMLKRAHQDRECEWCSHFIRKGQVYFVEVWLIKGKVSVSATHAHPGNPDLCDFTCGECEPEPTETPFHAQLGEVVLW